MVMSELLNILERPFPKGYIKRHEAGITRTFKNKLVSCFMYVFELCKSPKSTILKFPGVLFLEKKSRWPSGARAILAG